MTTFHTINGQILYQVDASGNRTEYVHDALGSVIATTDANRNVLNTYRYAPYGTQIAATEASPNPMFQWVGTWGYRATARTHAALYVRRRHYDPLSTTWVGVDKFWGKFGAYGYAARSPMTQIDPSGNAPWAVSRRIIPNYNSPDNCDFRLPS